MDVRSPITPRRRESINQPIVLNQTIVFVGGYLATKRFQRRRHRHRHAFRRRVIEAYQSGQCRRGVVSSVTYGSCRERANVGFVHRRSWLCTAVVGHAFHAKNGFEFAFLRRSSHCYRYLKRCVYFLVASGTLLVLVLVLCLSTVSPDASSKPTAASCPVVSSAIQCTAPRQGVVFFLRKRCLTHHEINRPLEIDRVTGS